MSLPHNFGRNKNRDRPFELHWISIPLVFGLLMCAFFIHGHFFHMEEVYPVQVITADFGKAYGDMSVKEKIAIMETEYANLATYTGNSKWPYPTAWTSVDDIKLLMSGTLDESRALLNLASVDDMAYQQGIVNLNQHIDNIYDRLGSYYGSIGYNPHLNPIGWFLGFTAMLSPIWMTITWAIIKDKAHEQWIKARDY